MELFLPSPTYSSDAVSFNSDIPVFSGQFLTPPDSSKKPPRQKDDNCFWSGIPELESFIQGVDEWKSEDSFIKPAEPLDTGFDILTSASEKTQIDSTEEIQTPEIGQVPYIPIPVEKPVQPSEYVIIPLSHYHQLCNVGTKRKERRYTPYDVDSVMSQRKTNRLSAEQKRSLEERYNKQRYINKNERVEIAAALGLTDKQVMYWFQNRRRKEKTTIKL